MKKIIRFLLSFLLIILILSIIIFGLIFFYFGIMSLSALFNISWVTSLIITFIFLPIFSILDLILVPIYTVSVIKMTILQSILIFDILPIALMLLTNAIWTFKDSLQDEQQLKG